MNEFSLPIIKEWLREKFFRMLFVFFLFAGLFLLMPDIYEKANFWFVTSSLSISAIVSYGVLRLLCRHWPHFLQFPLKAPLFKAILLFIIFLPVSFALLAPLFGWLGWLDEQSWDKPPHPTQGGVHAWFVGMWYGFCWAPLPALITSWFLCRRPKP